MIDLHAHLLPGMDDGARSWEEAIDRQQSNPVSRLWQLPAMQTCREESQRNFYVYTAEGWSSSGNFWKKNGFHYGW